MTSKNNESTDLKTQTLTENKTEKISENIAKSNTANLETKESTSESSSSKKMSFSETSAGAKLSGHYNIAAGKIKKTFGELIDDSDLKKEGRDQELKGKIHRFVGSLRGVREQVVHKIKTTRKETKAICKKHGGRMFDVATDFVEDMKKALLK